MSKNRQTEVLVAFAKAAAKAQEIESIFKDLLLAAEVAQDSKNRSLEEISAMIEGQTLGWLKRKFLEMVQGAVKDEKHAEMWHQINNERIFLMHSFFNEFDVLAGDESLEKASQRVLKIDQLLAIGCRMLSEVRERSFAIHNIPPTQLREFLAFVIDWRRKRPNQ